MPPMAEKLRAAVCRHQPSVITGDDHVTLAQEAQLRNVEFDTCPTIPPQPSPLTAGISD